MSTLPTAAPHTAQGRSPRGSCSEGHRGADSSPRPLLPPTRLTSHLHFRAQARLRPIAGPQLPSPRHLITHSPHKHGTGPVCSDLGSSMSKGGVAAALGAAGTPSSPA